MYILYKNTLNYLRRWAWLAEGKNTKRVVETVGADSRLTIAGEPIFINPLVGCRGSYVEVAGAYQNRLLSGISSDG